MPVVPPAPRHTLEDTGDELRFYIPSIKRWYLLLLLAFWLVMGIGIGSQFVFGFFPRMAGIDWFHVVWSIGWFLATGYGLLVLSWMLGGVEVI